MVLHKVYTFELSEEQDLVVGKIKNLKTQIDEMCENLIASLHNDGIDIDTIQDVMYYSGIIDIVGRINVNKIIKETYKLDWREKAFE